MIKTLDSSPILNVLDGPVLANEPGKLLGFFYKIHFDGP